MGRRRKSENQITANKKGEARMQRYEENQTVAEKVIPKDDERSVTFWEKIGENGTWEQKEYIIKTVKRS